MGNSTDIILRWILGQLQAENSQHVLKINELTEELNNTKVNLTNQINTVNLQLQEALKVIESQKAAIEKINERITLFEARATSIEARLTEYEAKAAQMQQDFVELRTELNLIKELNPYLITEQPTEEKEFQGKVAYYETAQQTYERLFREHNSQSTEFKEWSVIVQQELNSERYSADDRRSLRSPRGRGDPRRNRRTENSPCCRSWRIKFHCHFSFR